MEVFRLRANALKTPTGGGFYGHGSNKQRKSMRMQKTIHREQSGEYSPNSSYTTQLLIPPDIAPSPSYDDISINSTDLRNLLWNDGGKRQNTYELLKHQQRSVVSLLPPSANDDGKDMLASSFVLPRIGFDSRERTRPLTRELQTQTKKRILLREYLPTVKDHKIWRTEKCDPFLYDIKTALLQNKPANIEEYLIAYCEAKLAGNPVPETHKGHSGGDGCMDPPLIRIQSPPQSAKRLHSAQTTYDLEGLPVSQLPSPQLTKPYSNLNLSGFDDSRAITPASVV